MQRQVRGVDEPAVDVGHARRRHRDRALPAEPMQDRQVVDRKVPQHVHVGLHDAQVDAHGVEVVQVAQRPPGDELRQLAHRAAVDEGVVDHQDQAALVRLLGHRLALGGARRHGLLDQDVPPRPQRAQGKLAVRRRGGGDAHGVDRVVFEHRVEVAGHGGERMGLPGLFQQSRIDLAHGPQGRALERGEVAGKVGSPVPVSDDGDVHGNPPASRFQARPRRPRAHPSRSDVAHLPGAECATPCLSRPPARIRGALRVPRASGSVSAAGRNPIVAQDRCFAATPHSGARSAQHTRPR